MKRRKNEAKWQRIKVPESETTMPLDKRLTTMIYALVQVSFLWMSACSVVPVQKREAIPSILPEQFASTGATSEDQRLYWKQSFACEHLRVDVETLRDANFELTAARARVEQAAAAFGIVKSALMPSLDVKAEGDRSRTETEGTATTRNTIAFEAALNWELDLWGRLRARKKAAVLSLLEEQALTDQVALDLQTLLVESWVTHHAAVLQEEILSEQLQTNIQFLALTELRLAQGQGNALDVLQQRGRQIASQRSLPEVTSRKRRAANAYAVLLGQFPENGNLPAAQWPHPGRLTVLSSPRQLIVDRPDLRAAFLALQAADHEVAAAIADRLPRASIGLTYAESGSHLASMGNNTILRVADGLMAPVFDAGRLKAAAAQRKAEASERLALLEQAMLTAVQEVEDALTRENALFDEQRLIENESAIARDTVDKAKLRYVNGEENFLAVLVALAKLQTLQLSEISLQQELLINRGRLLRALGAKWQMESS